MRDASAGGNRAGNEGASKRATVCARTDAGESQFRTRDGVAR